jgi:predicted extracellular nuclease
VPVTRRLALAGAAGAALLVAFAACGQDGITDTTGSGGKAAGSASSTGGASGGGGAAGTPFAVMDWNVHNFFNDKQDSPEAGDNEIILSTADYQAKVANIGGVVKELSPDVVMFAEVEHQSILDDMNVGVLGGAYQTALIDGNDPRGIDVGVMTKAKPDAIVSHKDEIFVLDGTNGPKYQYARDCLEVHLTVGDKKVVLLGVHFRSKGGGDGSADDPDKRLAEAQHTRSIADALLAADPSLLLIILGDFNDTPGSPPVDAVSAGGFLDSASSVVPASDQYSFVFEGSQELLDHQISNPSMAKLLAAGTARLLHRAGVDDDSPAGSDHAPLFAVYSIR